VGGEPDVLVIRDREHTPEDRIIESLPDDVIEQIVEKAKTDKRQFAKLVGLE